MIRNTVVYSDNKDKLQAFEEIEKKISEGGAPLLIVFFSDAEGFDLLTQKFYKVYPNSTVIGSTSFVSYSSFGHSEYSLVAMAVYDSIEVAADVLLEVSHYPMRYASRVSDACEKLSNTKNTVCLEFCNAHYSCEELIQDTFRSVLEPKKIPVVGGTAGAEVMTHPTNVSLNGIVYSEACVFVLIKNLNGMIYVYKENVFKSTNRYLTATDVDCDERIVYEFDDKPATEAIASALDVPVKQLQDIIPFHPLGRMTGKDIYITSADRLMPDGSMSFFARIYNRAKLAIMEVDDLNRVWDETAKAVKEVIPNPSMSIAVNCYGRALFFRRNKQNTNFANKLTTEYGNFICMSGFGEQFNYEHFNQTMVLLVFE